MRCLIVFTALFLVVQIAQGVSEKIYARVGDSATFNGAKVANSTFTCFVTHNGNIYQMEPDKNLTNLYYNNMADYCSFDLNSLKIENAGVWTLHTKWLLDNRLYEKINGFELYIESDIEPLVGSHTIAELGTYVTLQSHVLGRVTNCTLVHLNGLSEPKVHNLLDPHKKDPHIERVNYNKCNARILVTESNLGDWYITQNLEPYHNGKFQFNIVKPVDYKLGNKENLQWKLGFTEKLQFLGISRPAYCEVMRPDGKNITIEDNSCTYQVPKVDYNHAGPWTIRHAALGRTSLIEKRFEIEVIDPDYIETDVNFEGGLHLMCRIHQETLDYCLFTRPDGFVINAVEGVENKGYKYHGNGFKKLSKFRNGESDCGLSLTDTKDHDAGTWKCTVGYDGKISSSLFAVIIKSKDKLPPTMDPIFVKRSDNFTIKCQTSQRLNYCWLRGPNNKIYTVSKNPQLENSLLYDGEGLDAGVCGARISNASDEYVGNWDCHLGIEDGSEQKTSVMVKITESYLYSDQIVIKNNSNGEKIILTCNVLPQRDSAINYCRWVRPDGYGIYVENSLSYETFQGRKSCSLEISKIDTTDFGNWTCYARLLDDSDNEVFATIAITQADQISVLTTTIICLVTIIPISLCIIALILYRKKICKRNTKQSTNFDEKMPKI